MNEREAYILLNMIEGIGPVLARRMIEALGSPQEILAADAARLRGVRGIGEKLAGGICAQVESLSVEDELCRAEEAGARILTPLDGEYPAALKKIHDPPLALYVWGGFEPQDAHALAVVGSRRATSYGLSAADRFSFQLAQSGMTIVSGLARGVDTAAHRGALKAGGRTVAVLGSALDQLYPQENAELARRISEQGAVISEYPFGRQADRQTFPYRNRIISGMSAGVLVVECGLKSGTLHTADAAGEQGRTVFAVPGRIDSAASAGCNHLIKNGACLVDRVDDILHEFEFLIPARELESPEKTASARPEVPLSDEERELVEALWDGALDVDTLARRCGTAAHRISGLLLGLEMKRVVKMLPGRVVELHGDLGRMLK